LSNTYTKLLVHVVFGTKNRTAIIPADLREDLYSYIGGIVRGEGGSLRAIGGMPDHGHLLVRVGLPQNRYVALPPEAGGAQGRLGWS